MKIYSRYLYLFYSLVVYYFIIFNAAAAELQNLLAAQ